MVNGSSSGLAMMGSRSGWSGIADPIRLGIGTIGRAVQPLVAIARNRAVGIFHSLRAHMARRQTADVAGGASHRAAHPGTMSAARTATTSAATAAATTSATAAPAATTGSERYRRYGHSNTGEGEKRPTFYFHGIPLNECLRSHCAISRPQINAMSLPFVSGSNKGGRDRCAPIEPRPGSGFGRFAAGESIRYKLQCSIGSMNRPHCHIGRLYVRFDHGAQPPGGHRQRSEPDSSCMRNGVGEGCRHRPLRGLAHAEERLPRAIDQFDLD